MKTVSHIMKGALRMAIRRALEEIVAGHGSDNEARMARGWNLLFRPRRGGLVPKETFGGKGAPLP